MNPTPYRSGRLVAIVLAAACLAACGGSSSETETPGAPPPPTPPIDQGTNLLQNGDFEQGVLDPWFTAVHAHSESFDIELSPGAARQGQYGVQIISHGSEPWGGVLQVLPDPDLAGSRLRMSTWIRGEGTDDRFELVVVFRSNAMIDPISHRVEGTTGTYAWREVELEFDVPERTRRVEVGYIHHGNGTIALDDARVMRVSP